MTSPRGTTCRAATGRAFAEACTGASAACPADVLVRRRDLPGRQVPATWRKRARARARLARRIRLRRHDLPRGDRRVRRGRSVHGHGRGLPRRRYVAAGTTCRPRRRVRRGRSVHGHGRGLPGGRICLRGNDLPRSQRRVRSGRSLHGHGRGLPAVTDSPPRERPAVPRNGVCDVAEACTGTGAACPGDGFASAGRPAAPPTVSATWWRPARARARPAPWTRTPRTAPFAATATAVRQETPARTAAAFPGRVAAPRLRLLRRREPPTPVLGWPPRWRRASASPCQAIP